MKTSKSSDAGNVIVEFIGVTVALLVPLAIIASASISVASGYLSTDISARTAVRAFVVSKNDLAANQNATSTARLAARDFDSGAAFISTKISCTKKPCLSPGGYVTVKVSKQIKLELPRVLGSREVTVASQHTMLVDELRAQ